MASTQYIGARYVPIFYTNPDDNSNNWHSGVAYDPLTIVTDLNQSYTSKIPVPANIGRPSENPTYWILTGAYNAQVEEYREEVLAVQADVADLQDDVAEIKNNKILFVGDSFNTIYPDAGWDMEFIRLAGLTSDDYFRINIAGAGFCTSPSWTDALNNRLSLITDKEMYKAVVICSGGNDKAYNLAATINGMSAFKTVVDANFPNAKMYVGFLGWSGLANQHTQFRAGLNTYIEACDALGIAYLHNVEYVLHWQPFLRNNQSVTPGDYFHPTIDGNKALGQKILQAYNTGSCQVKYGALMTFTPDGTKVTNISDESVSAAIDNEMTTVTINAKTYTFAQDVSAMSGAVIGSFSCDCFNPVNVANPISMRDLTNGNTIPVNFSLNGGKISISPWGDIAAHSQRSINVIMTFPTTSC